MIGLVMTDGQFRGLCAALNRSDLLKDPRFVEPGIRTINCAALFAALEESVRHLSTDEFLALARRHEVPFAPVNDLDAFFDDPQVRHNRVYFEMADEEFGSLRQLTSFAQLEKTPFIVSRRAPKLGEHTDEVLSEAGYAPAKIRELRETGTIH